MTTKMPYGDDAIRNGSGKDWSEWRAILDDWGAANKPHAEIAQYVHEEHGVDGWWAQGVTVGYERMTGKRAVGQRMDGSYSTSASKTIPTSIDSHFAAWVEDDLRDQWLPAGTLSLRTAKENASARFDDVESGGIVALYFTDKGPDKSSVAVQMDGLPSQDDADARKAAWKQRLTDLAAFLKR